MANITSLIKQMQEEGGFVELARNPLAQFGVRARRYIGAEILPERNVDHYAFRETGIRYRSVIASPRSRYSPPVLKKGSLVGEFDVILGDSGLAAEMDAQEYDTLIRLLARQDDMQAMLTLLNWVETVLNRPQLEHNERERWQALVDASVVRNGANGFTETISYPNPSGHRFNAGGTWSSDAYDPWADITAAAKVLADKGFTVSRIIAGRDVISKLAGNDKIKARTGPLVVSASGQIQGINGQATRAAINNALNAEGLPPIEEYNLQYRTQTGTGYFLSRSAMVLISETEQDELIDLGDSEKVLRNTLGYTAVGPVASYPEPGRQIKVRVKDDEVIQRVEGEAAQTSLPVLREPEAVAVIKQIA